MHVFILQDQQGAGMSHDVVRGIKRVQLCHGRSRGELTPAIVRLASVPRICLIYSYNKTSKLPNNNK